MVRCSVTCNTIPRMLEAYNKLMKHLADQSTSMKKARVKNGFLYPESKGYRDIKVNVVFESEDARKMICEIQFIYGQNLNEKKRSHRYYHLTRDRAFFDGVVQKEDGTILDPEQFEPILNVRDDVETGVGSNLYRKCAVNSELKMLFVTPRGNTLICVDLENKKVVFQTEAYFRGHHTHHWLNMSGQPVLSVQSSENVIKFFNVSDDGKQFLEDESLRITLSESDTVNNCEFDKKLENVFLVKNEVFLEQRNVSGDHGVVMTVKLEEKVEVAAAKQLCLSDDGRYCVIGSGWTHNYWFLIDTVSQTQFKLESTVMSGSAAPCFIGGSSDRVVIGGEEQFEIWDVNTRSSLQCIDDIGSWVSCMVSVGDILAVGSTDKVLKLYDIKTWKVIYSKEYELKPISLHLTADQKYLTVAGSGGEQCVVMKLFK